MERDVAASAVKASAAKSKSTSSDAPTPRGRPSKKTEVKEKRDKDQGKKAQEKQQEKKKKEAEESKEVEDVKEVEEKGHVGTPTGRPRGESDADTVSMSVVAGDDVKRAEDDGGDEARKSGTNKRGRKSGTTTKKGSKKKDDQNAAEPSSPAQKKARKRKAAKTSGQVDGVDGNRAGRDADEEEEEEEDGEGQDRDGDDDEDGQRKRRKRRPRAKLNIKATLKNYIDYLKELPDSRYENLTGKYLSTFGFEGVYQASDLLGEGRTIDEVIDWKKSPTQMHEVARIFEEACRRGFNPAGIASMCTEGKKLEKKFKTGDIEGRVYVGQFFAMFRNEECMKQYFDKEKEYPFAITSKIKVYENPLQTLDDELCA